MADEKEKNEKNAKKTSLPTKGKQGLGKDRLVQMLIVAALAFCCFIAFTQYRATTELIATGENRVVELDASKLDVTAQGEAEDVRSTGDAVASLDRAEGRVMQSAMLAAASGKQPFGTTGALIPPTPPRPIAPVAVTPEVIDPPAVTVRIVMVRGDERIAVIDVADEASGLVVREGSSFFDDAARITKINPEGVMFTWMKKSYEATIPK